MFYYVFCCIFKEKTWKLSFKTFITWRSPFDQLTNVSCVMRLAGKWQIWFRYHLSLVRSASLLSSHSDGNISPIFLPARCFNSSSIKVISKSVDVTTLWPLVKHEKKMYIFVYICTIDVNVIYLSTHVAIL